MSEPLHNPKCFASHLGLWMVEAGYMRQAVSAIKSGLWKIDQVVKASPMAAGKVVLDPMSDPDFPEVLYVVTESGIALVEINGVIAKAKGKYARASSVQTRRAMRAAAADQDVGGIMLGVDSPGGTVAGTQQLADEVRAADAVKPVHAYIDDMGASAGYWVPSQARRVSANRSALVGSLGTYMVVEDSSKKAEMEGVEVHVISTGPHKGAFVDGAPVTSEQLTEAQSMVDDLNALFMQGVAGGRRKSMEDTAKLFDGKVHIAEKAKALGLVDAVQTFDAAMAELSAVVAAGRPSPENARRMQLARARR